MKLSELNPAFIMEGDDRVLAFDCPAPKAHPNSGDKHRFRLPVTGPQAWHINTEGFDSLSMTPSVLDTTPDYCNVHFFITNGEIITV
jgi:hypothetical protein